MKEVKYTVQDEIGIHARPAAKLVESLSNFQSSVIIECEGKTANAKSIINLMSLGISGKSQITFKIEGEDEEKLASSLISILNQHGI